MTPLARAAYACPLYWIYDGPMKVRNPKHGEPKACLNCREIAFQIIDAAQQAVLEERSREYRNDLADFNRDVIVNAARKVTHAVGSGPLHRALIHLRGELAEEAKRVREERKRQREDADREARELAE